MSVASCAVLMPLAMFCFCSKVCNLYNVMLFMQLLCHECCKRALANASRHVFAFAQKY